MPFFYRSKTALAALPLSRIALFATSLALLSSATLLHAQSTYGSISGSVTDPSGAVIPNATILLTQTETGEARTLQSDARGDFQAVNVNAGVYTAVVSVAGFVERRFDNVVVLARQSVIIDAKLQVGTMSAQNIEVTAGAEAIDNDLTVSDTKSGGEINQLALNFRASSNTSPLVVANLAPTVQSDQNGNISIAGGFPNETAFSIDGISTQNVRNGGPNADLYPSVESIGEFKVNTGSNNAEFGQPSDITVTSKAGTNKLHGSVFYFTQNSAFNAADPIQRKVLPIIANDFGASLGGPVSIPHLYDSKDKTFFYFTYEGTRRPQSFALSEIVPSTSERAGILPTPAFNPCSQQVTTDFSNCITASSAAALNLLFPQPNVVNGPDDATNLYTIKGQYHLDDYDGRLDQIITQNQRVFAHYTHKDITNSGNDGDSSYNPLMGAFSVGQKLRNLAGSYNDIIRPNIINEFRAGFSQVNTAEIYPQAALGAAYEKQIGIGNLPPVPSSGGVSNFEVGNYVDGGTTNSFGRPRHVQQHIYEVGDNVTWIKGAHSLKFGGDFSRTSYIDQITFTNGDEFGDYDYTGYSTGSALGDFLTGNLTEADYAQNGPDGQPFAYHYGFFGQDDWKVTPRLTVSYGLRYEINPPFDDATHQLGQLDRNYPGGRLIVQNQEVPLIAASWRAQVGNTPFITASQAGVPNSLRYTYYGNYQPRLGFVYDTYGDGKTVLKAHVGSYSVPVLGAVLYSLLGVDTSNFPTFVDLEPTPGTGTSTIAALPNTFGGGGTYPVSCNSPSTLPAGATAGIASCPDYRRANEEHLKDPRVIQWNASVEQAIGSNTVFRLLYTGSHSTQLIWSPDLNQVEPNTIGYATLTANPAARQANLKYPNFNAVLTRDNGPSAKYNAGTAAVTRRFVNGLTYDGSYTFAKNLSNALGSAPSSLIGQGGQGDNGANGLNYFNPNADYGNVIFTRRNRFVNTFLYQLPFGRGKQFLSSASRPVDLAIGGWGLTGVTILQTGAFLTPTISSSYDPSGTHPQGRSDGNFQRPDCVAGQKPQRAQRSGSLLQRERFRRSRPGPDDRDSLDHRSLRQLRRGYP